jgi:ubiquinone/menaquinone biosynthesis C-methylase UbiE
MRTDYESHDLVYRRKHAAGDVGWGSEQDMAEHFSYLGKALTQRDFPKAGKLLELGCGAGNVSLWFARKGYEVDGIDISPTAVQWAREKAVAEGLVAKFSVGNVLDLSAYPDGIFDVLIDGHCLHCIIGDDRSRCLASARRVLKPHGALCVHTMCGDPTCDSTRQDFDPQSRCLVRHGIASRYLGLPEAIISEIGEAGFAIYFSEIEAAKTGEDQTMLMLLALKR